MRPVSIDIKSENQESEFEVRFKSDEGVGLLSTRSGRHYLILDSAEYWFDVTQLSYPRKKVCSCKNHWFKVRFDFEPRIGTDDFRAVEIHGNCTMCGKATRIGAIDVDFSPTHQLLEEPIVYCANPKLKCDVRSICGYWAKNDLARLLEFLNSTLRLETYCWYWESNRHNRRFERVDESNRSRLFSSDVKYLAYYFSKSHIDLKTLEVEGGTYVYDDVWRANELIELRAPLNMMLNTGLGELYYLHFSTQFIFAGIVIDKSPNFIELCQQIMDGMQEIFGEAHGRDRYDSQSEYERLGLGNIR